MSVVGHPIRVGLGFIKVGLLLLYLGGIASLAGCAQCWARVRYPTVFTSSHFHSHVVLEFIWVLGYADSLQCALMVFHLYN